MTRDRDDWFNTQHAFEPLVTGSSVCMHCHLGRLATLHLGVPIKPSGKRSGKQAGQRRDRRASKQARHEKHTNVVTRSAKTETASTTPITPPLLKRLRSQQLDRDPLVPGVEPPPPGRGYTVAPIRATAPRPVSDLFCDHCGEKTYAGTVISPLPINIATAKAGEDGMVCARCEHFLKNVPRGLRPTRRGERPVLPPISRHEFIQEQGRAHPGRWAGEWYTTTKIIPVTPAATTPATSAAALAPSVSSPMGC